MKVEIYPADPSDAEQLWHYIQQVSSESDNLLFGAEDLSLTVMEIKAILTKIQQTTNSTWLLAKVDGKLVGSAQLMGARRHRTEHRASLAISVLKSHWNQGIGSQLLKQLVDFSYQKGIEQIVLEVRSDNSAAIALYRKFGFICFGKLPNYFKIAGMYYDADYMWLNLSQCS